MVKVQRLFAKTNLKIPVCKSFFSKVLKLLAFQGVWMFLYSQFPLFFPLSGKNKGKSMDESDEQSNRPSNDKIMDENTRLINEVNEKIEACEDELLELPKQIKDANERLMLASMEFCYEKLRTNDEEIQEIDAWIKQVRIDLKKNIIKKQNREINSRKSIPICMISLVRRS